MRRPIAILTVVLAVVTACTDGTEAGTTVGAVASPSPSPSPVPSPSPSPSPSPTPSPTPPPPDRSALVARLAAATVFPDDVAASVAVLDAEGRPVFALDGDRPLLPASTAKLAPGAAAFLLFGPDHRISTTVEAVGELGADGVLRGRLELVGGGDPALAQADYRSMVYVARPHTELEALADAVVAAGIKVVTRGVVAAPDAFGGAPEAPGWKDGYLAVLDARRITALTVDAGLDVTVVSPPPNPELELVASVDPAQRAVELFRAMLAERGVTVRGDVGLADGPRQVVAEVESPPMLDHVRFAFERSDNHTADTLFRLVGRGLGADGWTGSGAAIAALLEAEGIDTDGMQLADGSGLSRDDRMSATTLASIDQVMRAGEFGDAWRDALAVAGEEGTLRRRLRGTVADGRFLGKSGTLDDVTALAGTVEGPDGEAAYHVAVVANVGPGVGRFTSLVVANDIIALLAEDAAGCVRVAPPEDVAEDEIIVRGLYVDCPA